MGGCDGPSSIAVTKYQWKSASKEEESFVLADGFNLWRAGAIIFGTVVKLNIMTEGEAHHFMVARKKERGVGGAGSQYPLYCQAPLTSH